MVKSRAYAAALLLCFSSAAWSANVFVRMYETGVAAEDPAIESSSAWEDGLLGALFDSGHIVSNADIVRLEVPELPQTGVGLAEALAGGAEYVIDVELEYGAATGSRRSPSTAHYRLSDSRGATIRTGTTSKLPATNSGTEDEQNAREIARALIGSIGKGR